MNALTKRVPREPTTEMLQAATNPMNGAEKNEAVLAFNLYLVLQIWRLMYDAAPDYDILGEGK